MKAFRLSPKLSSSARKPKAPGSNEIKPQKATPQALLFSYGLTDFHRVDKI